MGKSFWIILAVIVLSSVGLIFFVSSDDSNAPKTTYEALQITDTDHVQGNADASVVMVEYSDFQCPACSALYPLTKQVTESFGDQIAFVYRHFPLVSIHPNSMAASRASEAAANQDKFWEMHDMLFERQNQWASSSDTSSIFEAYASELGLDLDIYKVDVVSEETSKIITSSLSIGTSIGINATPTYFINGEQILVPQSVEEFRSAIQVALDSASNQ